MNGITRNLAKHPVFEPLKNHSLVKLTETSDDFPPEFNYFHRDGVIIRAVSACTGTAKANSKAMMALAGIYDGVINGHINQDTTVVEQSSGNTAKEMAQVCIELGLRFEPIMNQFMPTPKLNAVRVLAGGLVQPRLVSGGGAQLARTLGQQEGFYNPDQYGKPWNPIAQRDILAPQALAGSNEDAAAIFPLAGSCGTPIGLAEKARRMGLPIEVKMVVVAGHDDLSGGKNLFKIKEEVLHDWRTYFPEEGLLQAPRYQSILLSYLSWPYVVKRIRGLRFMFGHSFGASVWAAFEWANARKKDGTLDKYRRKTDGKVLLLTFGADDYSGYTDLYASELKDSVLGAPRKLPPLDELLCINLDN